MNWITRGVPHRVGDAVRAGVGVPGRQRNITIPWWWAENRDNLRLRQEKVLEQREVFRLQTVDHGQIVKYRPVETAKNGLMRVGSYSRYGFGELRLKPLDKQHQESEK